MARKKRTPEENVRREKIRELLQQGRDCGKLPVRSEHGGSTTAGLLP